MHILSLILEYICIEYIVKYTVKAFLGALWLQLLTSFFPAALFHRHPGLQREKYPH